MFFAFSANATHKGYYDNHGNYIPGPAHHGGGYNRGYGYGGSNHQNPGYNEHGNSYNRGSLVCVTDHGNCRISGHGQPGNSCRCGSASGYVRGGGSH